MGHERDNCLCWPSPWTPDSSGSFFNPSTRPVHPPYVVRGSKNQYEYLYLCMGSHTRQWLSHRRGRLLWCKVNSSPSPWALTFPSVLILPPSDLFLLLGLGSYASQAAFWGELCPHSISWSPPKAYEPCVYLLPDKSRGREEPSSCLRPPTSLAGSEWEALR